MSRLRSTIATVDELLISYIRWSIVPIRLPLPVAFRKNHQSYTRRRARHAMPVYTASRPLAACRASSSSGYRVWVARPAATPRSAARRHPRRDRIISDAPPTRAVVGDDARADATSDASASSSDAGASNGEAPHRPGRAARARMRRERAARLASAAADEDPREFPYNYKLFLGGVAANADPRSIAAAFADPASLATSSSTAAGASRSSRSSMRGRTSRRWTFRPKPICSWRSARRRRRTTAFRRPVPTLLQKTTRAAFPGRRGARRSPCSARSLTPTAWRRTCVNRWVSKSSASPHLTSRRVRDGGSRSGSCCVARREATRRPPPTGVPTGT